MKFLVSLLAVAAFAVAAPAASADYGLNNDDDAIIVSNGNESSVAVDYSTICVPPICSGSELVQSTNGVPFTPDPATDCAVGSDASQFNCPQRDETRITGGSGADRINGSCFNENSSLTFTGGGGDDEVSVGSCTGSFVDMGAGNDTAIATGTIVGGDGRDTLRGRGGNDNLQGGGGRDLLIPGTGADSVSGGADPDTGSYEDRTQPVTVILDNLGNDGQPGEGDNIGSDVENLVGGAGDDTLTGDANPNDIDGGDGGDVIDGLGGPDFIDGGTGNDRITARDGAQDRVICGDGNDLAIVDAFDTVVACEDVQSSRELMPDVDADGVPAPADCADRDGRRRPGFIDKPGNGLDEDCDGRDEPFFRVLSPVQSTFSADGRRTRVLRLRVLGVPQGGRIELRCRGRGCFRGVRRFNAPRGAERRNIRRPLRGRVLRPRARIEVRILDADSIGKVQRFTVRRGRLPRSQSLCLVPGERRPGRCPRF
jgi:hemolysin type calcium-binding protein